MRGLLVAMHGRADDIVLSPLVLYSRMSRGALPLICLHETSMIAYAGCCHVFLARVGRKGALVVSISLLLGRIQYRI